MADVSNFAPMKLERILEESQSEMRKVNRGNAAPLSRQRKSKDKADAKGQNLAGMSFNFEHTGSAATRAIPHKTSRDSAPQPKTQQVASNNFKGCSPPPPSGKGTASAAQGVGCVQGISSIGSVQGVGSSCTVWGGKAQVSRFV